MLDFIRSRIELRIRTVFYLIASFSITLGPFVFSASLIALFQLKNVFAWVFIVLALPISLWAGQILNLILHPWLIRMSYRTSEPPESSAVARAFREIYPSDNGPAVRWVVSGPLKKNVFVTGILDRGATIYLDRELAPQFSQSEWKSILSHEIGHLEMNHVARRIHRGFLMTMSAIVIAAGALLTLQMLTGAGALFSLSWIFGAASIWVVGQDQSRVRFQQEVEADSFACLLDRAHFEFLPRALAKMNEIHGLASHPISEARIAQMAQLSMILVPTEQRAIKRLDQAA